MKYDGKYYLGLDIGTDSVGYAVTNEEYDILKFHGEPAWGTTVFDAASLSAERRSFRSARRRLDRRQQRVFLLQELFAKEIAKKDEKFFIRLQESRLYREETSDKYILFNDEDFTDQDYYKAYPTIHHLICDLMYSDKAFDVRLVYLACSWLLAHRGHFLSNVNVNNIEEINKFRTNYDLFCKYFIDNDLELPWDCSNINLFASVLKEELNITNKTKRLEETLFTEGKAPKKEDDYPFSKQAIIKLLAGGSVKLKDLFGEESYEDFGSVSLGLDDEKLAEISGNIGDDFDLIESLRRLYDWAVLSNSLGDSATISEAKVAIYEQHKSDLIALKRIVRKYINGEYDAIFRKVGKDNYPAYVYHSDEQSSLNLKRTNVDNFSKFILAKIEKIEPENEDVEVLQDMKCRLELRTFLPKQKNTDNRVIPCQLYHFELRKILDNAEEYLPFLRDREDGMSVREKIESIFTYKIPYFVGPLNKASEHAWVERKAGKIYPWNFEDMVDLDASENNFIKRMTNTCTYIPGETVLPKDSLAYHKYTVLNEINNLKINGNKISVELKQAIYKDLFMREKKVTKAKLIKYLKNNGVISDKDLNDNADLITGIDININSNLSSQIAFGRLLDKKIVSEEDVEAIIERASYAEDKSRLSKWIGKQYPNIDEEDRNYICRIRIKDFGRLSKKFLCEIEGTNKSTGEIFTIMSALWNTQDNLMELLSSNYTFVDEVNALREEYYAAHPLNLKSKMDEMYLSNTVRRSVYRTLAIVSDVEKAFGKPKKIFVETTRENNPDKKGKRTQSRKDQILELYKKCKNEDVRILKKQLEEMGELADNKLQGDKLFLYYMQLGKCMYTGASIDIEKLGTRLYDVDHIYPQAYIKDDSVLNNKVLVLSEENGKKSDTYPIEEKVRHKMIGYWKFLEESKLITSEKYKRLTRGTPFTDEEKQGFISRQLVETSQSNKAVAELLKTRFPNTEIVYSKAGLVSDFRHEYDLLKSRTFNDLHHAKDAYLNVVVGNVYSMKFNRQWFRTDTKYSIKTKTIFEHPFTYNNVVVWDGSNMLAKVKRNVAKNNAHFTKFSYFKGGGLFDQMPVHPSDNLVPLKKGLDTSKYGGYNKSGAMFFIPVKYHTGKKTDIIIMSVEMRAGKRFILDEDFSKEYCIERIKQIRGEKPNSIEFPMGIRPWKVNTMLELDGFRACITGMGSGGKCIVAQPIIQFAESQKWNNYIKRLERLVEKSIGNKNYIFDSDYDKVDKVTNEDLYDVYIGKLQNTLYTKRINNPIEIILDGKEKFKNLDEIEQAKVLLHILEVFGRASGGSDLTLIGGGKSAAATCSFSSNVSNWKKNYSDIRIVDISAAGLRIRKSQNILELL